MAEEVKLTKEELAQVKQAIQEIAQIRGVKVSEVKMTKNSITELAKEIASGIYKKDQKLQGDLKQSLINELKDQKRAILEQEKKDQTTWGKINRWLNEKGNKEDLATQYRARQVASGLDSMFSGNFLSGVKQIGSAFPRIANFMGGPYYMALEMIVRGLLKLDDALAKATKAAASMTGGLQSDYLNKSGFSAMAFNKNLKQDLYNIGMQNEFENLSGALIKGYGMGSYQGNQRDFITSMAYAQKGLGAYGISADSSNNLISNLRLLEGKNTTGIYAQLDRLSKTVASMKYFSPDQAMQQMSSLFEQTKMLGINFEWANRAVQQFERGLKEGTISMSDFAAVNRGLRGGGISRNAGIAEMLISYASRTGLNLPSNLLNSDPMGRGFALSTKSMLSNNQFALAYQGMIQEQINQMGGATKQDKAARLQEFLKALNVNISPEMAESTIKSNGQIDLIGSKIIGTRMGEREDEENKRAEDYQKLVESYYKGTTSWHDKVLTNLGKIVNNTSSKIAQGLSGEVSSEYSFGEFIGYIPHAYKDMFKAWRDFVANNSDKFPMY